MKKDMIDPKKYESKKIYWKVDKFFYNSLTTLFVVEKGDFFPNIIFSIPSYTLNPFLYISYCCEKDHSLRWGFMEPDFLSHGKRLDSKIWFSERGYKYMGDIGRIEKLKKLKEISLIK
jgi:hypothetical protein